MNTEYNLCGLVCRIYAHGEFKWIVFVRVFTDRYSAIAINSCNRWTEKFLVKEEFASLQEIADYLDLDIRNVIPCTSLKLALD